MTKDTGWQDMKTAPKHGEVVMLRMPDGDEYLGSYIAYPAPPTGTGDWLRMRNHKNIWWDDGDFGSAMPLNHAIGWRSV